MLIFFSSKTTFNWIITSSLPFFFCPTGFKNENKNYSFPYWDDKPLLETFVQGFRHLGVYHFSQKSCFVLGILITCNYSFYAAKLSSHYSQQKSSISNSPKSNGATNKVEYRVIFFFSYLFTVQDLCENQTTVYLIQEESLRTVRVSWKKKI